MNGPKLKVEYRSVGELIPYANNSKEHPEEQVRQIANSIDQFGNCDPVAVWTRPDGQLEIVEGHGRVLALKELGIQEVPCIRLDHLDDDARRAYSHVHNQLTLTSGLDMELLQADIGELPQFDWKDFGFTAEEIIGPAGSGEKTESASLAERFGIPPLSVINARSGDWIDRNSQWIAMGIRSEVGRT